MADDKKRALEEVRKSDRMVREWGHDLGLAVIIARDKGATWEEIGDVLGVTKQAAQMRFGKGR
jgi:hypothetical protein